MRLSYLRCHKNRRNFADTPSDICLCKRGVEDTSHFLLFCPFYITHRETLNARVNEILRRNNLDFIENTELYLYGHSFLKNLDNQKILAARIYQKYHSIFDLGYASHPSPPLHRPVFNFVLHGWVFINIFIFLVVNVVIFLRVPGGGWIPFPRRTHVMS